MAFFAKKHKLLEQEVFTSYSKLNEGLGKLIEYVCSKLPENAEEILYDDSFNVKKDEDFPKADFKETYVLTYGKIKIAETMKIEDGKTRFNAKNVRAVDLLADVIPEEFEKICMTLQDIIDRHKIKIPAEYLSLADISLTAK